MPTCRITGGIEDVCLSMPPVDVTNCLSFIIENCGVKCMSIISCANMNGIGNPVVKGRPRSPLVHSPCCTTGKARQAA